MSFIVVEKVSNGYKLLISEDGLAALFAENTLKLGAAADEEVKDEVTPSADSEAQDAPKDEDKADDASADEKKSSDAPKEEEKEKPEEDAEEEDEE